MPKGMDWYADEIHLKDYDLTQLPDSPICPILVKLFLQVPSLTIIPPTFFEHMPVLEVLDLSNTNIVFLPTSISSLSLLQEFFLRDCSALMELPTQIGMLSKLKLFDIKGTEIMFIPKEMEKLKNLEVLRVSLSEYAKDYIGTESVNETVIPQNMITELKQLKELCISVCPEAKWWEEEVKFIQSELCDLENLEILRWYLPTNEVLQQFLLLERNHVPIYADLSNLMLTIGQHAQLTSCLPRDLEKKFEEFRNCLKWINAEGNMDDISKVMASAEALFLSRHWTIEKLSTLNVTNLKYCLLAECNEMETLVEVDGLTEEVETRIKNGEKVGFEMLQYLSIHHMNKLQSIWKGPIGKDSLSKLTVLALHTCTQLTSVFTPTIAQNLSCLTELTVENCPKVRSLISNESHNFKHGQVFPSLDRIFLLDLPELVNIFGGLIILEKLSTLLIYSCLKLQYLSITELPHIKKIEGEIEWWKALDCDKSPWENIFVLLKRKRDLVEQLSEATNSLQHFHDTISHEYDQKKSSDLTDFREQVITADTSMEKGKGIFFPPKGPKDDESYGWSLSEAPDTETGTNFFYSSEDMDRFSLSRQETEDDESYGSCHSEASGTEIETDSFYSFGEVDDRLPHSGQGGGMLGVTKPKWQDTLKSTWKAIKEPMPQLTTHLSKSDKLEIHGQGLKSRNSEELLIDNHSERVTKLETLGANVGGGGSGSSSREPPLEQSQPGRSGWHRKEWLSVEESNQSLKANTKKILDSTSTKPPPLRSNLSQSGGSGLPRREWSLGEYLNRRVSREPLPQLFQLSMSGKEWLVGKEELDQRMEAFIKILEDDMSKEPPPTLSLHGRSVRHQKESFAEEEFAEEELDERMIVLLKIIKDVMSTEPPPPPSQFGRSVRHQKKWSVGKEELDQRMKAFLKILKDVMSREPPPRPPSRFVRLVRHQKEWSVGKEELDQRMKAFLQILKDDMRGEPPPLPSEFGRLVRHPKKWSERKEELFRRMEAFFKILKYEEHEEPPPPLGWFGGIKRNSRWEQEEWNHRVKEFRKKFSDEMIRQRKESWLNRWRHEKE